MNSREEEKEKKLEALRILAEKMLRIKGSNTADPAADMYSMQEIIHELQVQQVELEMQNEELMDARVTIEKSLHNYANLYEFAPVAYFTLDRYGIILKANHAASQLVGYSPKMLLDKPFRSLILTSQASDFYDFINEVFTHHSKQVGTFELTTKEGIRLFVQMEAQSIDGQDNPFQCLLAAIDITARKEAESKLQLEKAFSESLLENSIDGILAFDTKCSLIAWNKAMESLTGKPRTHVMGKHIVELFADYKTNDVEKAIYKALQGEASVLHDLSYGLKEGFYEVYTLPLFANDQAPGQPEVTGGFIIVHEVTERIKLEKERTSLKLKGQKELLNAILQAQEEERKRIAEGLHNGIGQMLYAAKLNIEQIRIDAKNPGTDQFTNAKKQVNKLLEEAIKQTRTISHELVPTILQDFGLEGAVQDLVKRYNGQHHAIQLEIFGLDLRLDKYVEIALYRMAQELLNNIVKHAQATQIKVQLVKGENGIVLKVTDNGKGFNVQKNKKGMGLRSIRDRVELLNGTIYIQSTPNLGTSVHIVIPE